ncbi:MAG: SRPBCC family protein [Pseudomonadota bacterium]
MAEVIVQSTVNAPPELVWKSWDDFGNIAKFNPNLASSYLLGNQPTGKGATRQCNLIDGKNHIRERIVEYVENERMVLEIYDGTMPLKKAIAVIVFEPKSEVQTLVQMQMTFTPKFGPFGAAMIPMMKPKFRKMLQALLDANAEFVEAIQT